MAIACISSHRPNAQIVGAARARGLPVETLPIEQKRLPGLAAMRRWLARHGAGFDVINAHSSTDAWLAALARTTLPRAPKIVRTRHLSTPVNRLPTTRWLYQRATSHIVVTGEALKTRLVSHNGYDPATITSVRTGIDLARFAPRDRAAMRAQCGVDARPAVGIVATLRDWKGHDYLLDAWGELQATVPGWQLLIIGDGPRRAASRTAGAGAGVGGNRALHRQSGRRAGLACVPRPRRAAFLWRRRRAAKPDAGGGVRTAVRLHAGRRHRRSGRATARPACSCRRAIRVRLRRRWRPSCATRRNCAANGPRRACVRAGALRHRRDARRDGSDFRARRGERAR